jgi:DNA-binding Lrp family transcriptional regulator
VRGEMLDIDEVDRKIIGLLMEDVREKVVDIAQVCGISYTAVQNRIRKMKQTGIIVKHTWNVDWSFFGYTVPVTICVDLKPESENEVYQLVTEKVIVMSFEHFLGACDLYISAFAKNIENLKELDRNLRNQKGVTQVKLNIWNKSRMNFKFNRLNKKQRQEGLDRTDIQIFKKLLDSPAKPFLRIAEEIGIAPITAQKRYKRMERMGILKSSIVVDFSKIGYPLKALFVINLKSDISNQDLIFETLEKTSEIFLFAETIGSFDVIAVGLFKNLDELQKVKRKFRALASVESIIVSISDEADFPFKREYDPSQIFKIENVENLIGATKA